MDRSVKICLEMACRRVIRAPDRFTVAAWGPVTGVVIGESPPITYTLTPKPSCGLVCVFATKPTALRFLVKDPSGVSHNVAPVGEGYGNGIRPH